MKIYPKLLKEDKFKLLQENGDYILLSDEYYDSLVGVIKMRIFGNFWPKGLDQRVSKPIELKDKEVPPGITKEKDNKMNSKENQYPLPMDDKIIR